MTVHFPLRMASLVDDGTTQVPDEQKGSSGVKYVCCIVNTATAGSSQHMVSFRRSTTRNFRRQRLPLYGYHHVGTLNSKGLYIHSYDTGSPPAFFCAPKFRTSISPVRAIR